LLRITAGIGIFIIAYSLIRHFTGFTINDYFGESAEKTMFDTIVFVALGLFLYNRKMAADERKEREAAEKAKAAARDEAEVSGKADETDRDGAGGDGG
ncbi:MAG: hypothetical protein LBP74_00125, partial [Treponema sp.]|nr:hypothetical protein [Treponema sp.]